MKKQYAAALLSSVILLGGCSGLEEVNSTVTYINEATEYAGEARDFASETPALAQQAIQDEQAAQDLEGRLEEMKQNIEEFNELEPPQAAASIHDQVENQNNRALQGIDTYLNSMEDGKLDPAVYENTEIFKTFQEISSIVDQVQKLQ